MHSTKLEYSPRLDYNGIRQTMQYVTRRHAGTCEACLAAHDVAQSLHLGICTGSHTFYWSHNKCAFDLVWPEKKGCTAECTLDSGICIPLKLVEVLPD